MYNFAKRVTSVVVAGAVVLGTLAFYPGWNKGKVNAAELYDSASAINYATVLGGAVDYGIVSGTLEQNSHTETTFATNHFIHTKDNNDVDFVDSTALFLIGETYTGNGTGDDGYIRFGKTTASAIYFEAPSSVFGPGPNGEVFDPNKAAGTNVTNGNFKFETKYTTTPFIQAVNANANVNVNRLINRLCENKAVEDAEKGWSYFLEDRAISPEYVLNTGNKVASPATITPNDFSGASSSCTINIEDPFFSGKVVYINLTKEMVNCLKVSGSFIIEKRQDTVVVFNIEDNAIEDGILLLKKPVIKTNSLSYVGCTATNGNREASGQWGSSTGVKAADIQSVYNETVIWNVMTSKSVELHDMGGVMLFPNAQSVTLASGNSSGWIVAKNRVNMDTEFHFLYSGSSRDSYGQMHFALTKAFTKNYAAHGSVQQDASVSIDQNTYKFKIQEYEAPASARGDLTTPYTSGFSVEKYAETNATVTFDSLTFYCDNYDRLTDAQRHYYIQKPQSDTPNSRMFYFRITEDGNNIPANIEKSDGYVDIRLKVEVDKYGNFTYFVDYKSVTGDGIVFRDYGADYTDFIKMSGVQFDLGAFYNKVKYDTSVLDITKTFGGNVTPADFKNLTFKLYEVDQVDDTKVKLVETYKFGSDFELVDANDTSKGYHLKTKYVADKDKRYYVEETNCDNVSGYKLSSVYYTDEFTSNNDITASHKTDLFTIAESFNESNPYDVNFTNSYIQTTVTKAFINITKTVGGDITGEDFDNLSFNVYEVIVRGSDTEKVLVGTYRLGSDFDQTIVNANEYKYELKNPIEVDATKHYCVEEINYDVNTQKTVKVTYTLNNGTEETGFEADISNISSAYTNNNPYLVAFNDQYTSKVGDLSVEKQITEKNGLDYDPNMEFTINIKLSNGGTYTIEKSDNSTFTQVFNDNVEVPFKLKAGEKITIKDLPEDTVYAVTEEAPSNTYYRQDGEIKNSLGLIVSGNPMEVVVNNKYSTAAYGSITVNKTVTGGTGEIQSSSFAFTLKDQWDNYYDAYGKRYNNTPVPIFVVSGKPTIINDLPAGTVYTVEEITDPDAEYTAARVGYELACSYSDKDGNPKNTVDISYQGGSGEINIANAYTVSSGTGTLTVKKIVDDTGAQGHGHGTTYTFKVQAEKETETKWVQDTNGTLGTDSTKTFNVTEGGASVDFTGLDLNYKYTVIETAVTGLPTGYSCATTYNDAATGTVSFNSSNEASVVIKNTYSYTQPTPITVNISKQELNSTSGTEVDGAELKITYIDGGTNVDLSGVTLKQGTTDITSATSTKRTTSSIIFVSGTEKTVITGIQPGNYSLEETVEPNGYNKQTSLIYFTVGTDGKVTATQNIAQDVGSISGDDTVIILNKKQNTSPTSSYINITKTFGGNVTVSDFIYLEFDIYEVDGTNFTLYKSYQFGNDFEETAAGSGVYELKVKPTADTSKKYYVVEKNYDVSKYETVSVGYVLSDNSSDTVQNPSGDIRTPDFTVGASSTFVAAFTNTYKEIGSLVISKTIKLPDNAQNSDIGTITFTIYESDKTTVVDTITLNPSTALADGWTVDTSTNTFEYTYTPVTPGEDYYVEETCNTASTNYSASSSAPGQTQVLISAQTTVGTVSYTNTYSTVTVYTGSLVIEKTIELPAGASMSDIGDITFTIVPDIAGTSTIVLDPDNPGTGWVVNGNVFTYTFDNLVQGVVYTVEETVDGSTSSYAVTASSSGKAQVTIPTDTTGNTSVSAGFTNTYSSTLPTVGYIEFTKTFGGDVTEAEAAGCGLYFVITNEAGEYLDLDGNISSDEVRITLKDMDHTDGTLVWSKTINDVPFDTYYVTEHNEVIYINGGKVPYTFEKTTSVTTDHTTLWNTSEDGYFDLENYYTHPGFDVTISKEDIAGKEIAQAQLKFKSLDGYDLSKVVVTQNGVPVQFTLSENNTAITFTTIEGYPSIIQGLFSGRYELEETVTPEAYLTAEKIVFVLNNDGTITDGEGKISAYGSPVVMIDQADPYYDTEVISANRTPNPIPATGEQSNYIALVGIALVGLCSAALAGLGVYRKKRNEF